MYVDPNYKTKKALKEAISNGKFVRVYQPNSDLTGVEAPQNAKVSVEGPHYPELHRWYAVVRVVNGRVTEVVE